MNSKFPVFIFLFLICCKSLSGQCPESDLLLKAIFFLRDSSGLVATEQIESLSRYEPKIGNCATHDSVHVLFLQRLGKLFYTIADYKKAISYYQRSIDLINQAPPGRSINPNELIPAYYWLAASNDSLHRIADKMKALDSCAAVSIRLNSIDNRCLWALYTRIEYYFSIGDYHQCIFYANYCESLATEYALKGSTPDAQYGTQYAFSSFLWNINALMVLKKYDEAQALLEKKAVECKERKMEHNLGVIYGSLAEVLELKGDFDRVLFYHDRAFAIEKKSGESINCKAMLNSLGYDVWFKHYKDEDKALKYYKRALDYKVPQAKYQILNSLESLSILNRIANVFVLKGKYDDAIKYIQLAFDQIKPGMTETVLLQISLEDFIRLKRIGYVATLIIDKAEAFHQRFKFTGDLNDITEAIRIFKVADQFLEKIKEAQSDVRSKLLWRSDRRRLYEFAIQACHEIGNTKDAFYFFERSRAVILNDQLNELHLMNQEDILKQEYLKKALAQLNKQLEQEDKTSDRSRRLQEQIINDRQELDKLHRQISARNPLYYQSFKESDLLTVADIQRRLLKNNDMLVEFFDGDSAVYLLIISSIKASIRKLDKEIFEHTVSGFVSYLSNYSLLNKNFKKFTDLSYELYNLLFQESDLPPGKIIVSPDSHYFPAEALITNREQPFIYLIQNHPVSYIHSVRLLMNDAATSTSHTGVKNFLGMAPVDFPNEPSIPSLTGSDISLKKLSSNFPSENNLLYSAASKNNFMQQFSLYEIIQLYTHASENESKGEPEIFFADSVLHLSELSNERKPMTRLIVLSACETGVGQWYRGEGVFSFNRGFTSLGVPSSVTNLWSVDNVSTYQLTEFFYKYLEQSFPLDVALQKAKLDFINNASKEKSLPYYWASAILAGKTDAIIVKRSFKWQTIAISITLCGCLFLSGFIIWSKRRKTNYLPETSNS